MFAAKSNLDGLSAHDILLTDAKDFTFGEKLFKIAVLETTNPDASLSKRADLEVEMENIISTEHLTGMFFFVVNILTSEATLLTVQEEDLQVAEKAFETKHGDDGLVNLPGVVSRKKQIVPAIEKVALS
jgi:manganese-dependent inorganic pyrophosphatase